MKMKKEQSAGKYEIESMILRDRESQEKRRKIGREKKLALQYTIYERTRVNSLLSKNVRCVVMALPGHLSHQPS